MKKYLWLFAFLFVVSVIVTARNERYGDRPPSPIAKAEEFAVGPTNVPKIQSGSQERQPHSVTWNFAYLVFGFPGGITVWALFLTMMVIAEQTRETKRSADAAKDAADSSLLSARSLINIERPWIIVTAKSYGHWRFLFEATNHGKSPAEIVGVADGWKIVRGGEDGIPHYEVRNAMNPRMVFPGDKPYPCGACNVGDLISRRPDENKIISGEGLLMMFGKVLYYDLLNRKDPPHETRFCFFWDSTDPQTVDDRDTSNAYVGYT